MAIADRIAAATRQALGIVAPQENYVPHEPTQHQRLFLGLPHAEAFYGGAAGGGKSDSLLMGALTNVGVPSFAALILRRTYADLSKPGALMDRAHEWLRNTGARWSQERKQWRFPSGAVLAFGYLENPNDKFKFQSSEFQHIAFDELTQFQESEYLYLFSRLRRLADADVPLRMRSASNPGGIGAEWVQARFIPDDWTPEQALEMRVIEKAGRAFVPARLADNPHLDRASYEESLQNLDEVTRAQLLAGDWQIRMRGNIYRDWSENHHVITWTQFQGVFKERRIPSHWLGAQGMDAGFDPDPNVTIWNFTAAANGPLPGAIFVPAILTNREAIPDDIAEQIKHTEAREGWAGRVQFRIMSHEASAQQATYIRKHGLNFQKCKPDAHGGISQMQNVMRLTNLDKPHPFKPWLKGRPNYYVIVPDDQVTNPKGDYGLALLRAEFPAYKYTDERVTQHLGASAIKPYKHFDHCMDAQRYIAGEWFPRIKPLTQHERLQRELPENWQDNYLRQLDPVARQRYEDARNGELQDIKERIANSRRPRSWASDIYDDVAGDVNDII